MTTLTEADDAICTLLKQAWDPTGHDMDWPNVTREGPALFDGDAPWGRLTIKLTDSEQRTLAEQGGRRFTRMGEAVVQVFVPAGERGLERARALGMVALNAFEGISFGGVRFVRVRPKDIGPDGPWYQFNVEVSYEFDEVK